MVIHLIRPVRTVLMYSALFSMSELPWQYRSSSAASSVSSALTSCVVTARMRAICDCSTSSTRFDCSPARRTTVDDVTASSARTPADLIHCMLYLAQPPDRAEAGRSEQPQAVG